MVEGIRKFEVFRARAVVNTMSLYFKQFIARDDVFVHYFFNYFTVSYLVVRVFRVDRNFESQIVVLAHDLLHWEKKL